LATEQQYDVFKSLYDEEGARYRDLSERAKTYISVVTIFSGFLVFKSEDLKNLLVANPLARWSFALGVLLFIGALVALVAATRIRRYVRFANPEKIIEDVPDDEDLTNEQFFNDRIGELAVSTNQNARCNDELAQCLTFSSSLLMGATAAMFLSLAARILG
jgi:hypothetical protein